MDEFSGLREAAKFDAALEAIKKENRVEQNPEEWLKFARTLKTSVELIEREAIAACKDALVEQYPGSQPALARR